MKDELKDEISNLSIIKSDDCCPEKKKVKFNVEKVDAPQSPEINKPTFKSKSFINFKSLD
jgi:hypothetical protein